MTDYKVANTTVIQGSNGSFTNIRWNSYLGKLYNMGAQGFDYGYNSGGIGPTPTYDVIDRFPFAATTTNATDVGNLILDRYAVIGQSSSTYGYASGGYNITRQNVIDRWPFSSSTTDAADVGDLTVSRNALAGQSSTDYGYASSGIIGPPTTATNTIDRWPFSASTTDATDVGDLFVTRDSPAGQSSSTYGYASGGIVQPATYENTIDRWPFSSSTTDAADVGNLSVSRFGSAGQSSTDYGYASGGSTGAYSNVIDRWPFASSTTNATDVGNLSVARSNVVGQSSTDYGYTSGGFSTPPLVYYNNIDRWPFTSSTTNATDVGDMTVTRYYLAGQQY